MSENQLRLHGTSVDMGGMGILICGKPGSGKSSLALQLIDRGAILIADDQTLVSIDNKDLILQCPIALKGIMEIRNVGICSFPSQQRVFLKLCIEICEKEQIDRLPEPLFIKYHGIEVPLLKLKKDDPIGALKIELKLYHKDKFYVK